MFQRKAVENIKTHISCSITSPPPPKIPPFLEKFGKNLKRRAGSKGQYGA